MTTVLPRNSRMYGSASRSPSALRGSVIPSPRLRRASPSQNVPRQVLVAGDVAEASPHVAGVDGQLLAGHLGGVERDLLQQPLHDRVAPPRPDVLRARVHLHRNIRDRLHRVRRELESHLLRPQQLRVLLEQRVLRFRQDADEILARQGVELDADREAPLELGDEVRGLRDVKGAGRDEQDVVGAHDPVLGRDGRALHDRQQVPLDALAGDVGPGAGLAPGDLVDVVEEDDPRVPRPPDRLRDDLFHVDELLRLLLNEEPPRLGDPHPAPLGPRRHEIRQHVLQVDPHLLHALTGEHFDHRHRLLLRLELDHPVVEPAGSQLDPELVHRGLARGIRRHLLAQLGRQVLPPPAVAQRDGHGALGPLLADDVAVELGDDLRRGERQILIHRTSTLMWSLVKTQIEAATRIASVTMPLASRSECATSARAAASAYAPPEPMPMRPSSGSITSPLPEMMNECSRSATARSASSLRRTRSVRQALAPSTAARSRLPRCSSSRLSKREKSVNASAAVPAKPARMRSWESFRTFFAPAFTMVFPIETWPSPATATWSRWRTATTVVASKGPEITRRRRAPAGGRRRRRA